MTNHVPPTQVRHPRQASFRTTFQVFVGLCALAPVIVAETGMQADDLPWLAVPLAVAAAVTRIMANPKVDRLLTLIGLGSRPKRDPL